MNFEDIKKVAIEKLVKDNYDESKGFSYAIATKDVDSYGGDSQIVVWLTEGDEYHDAVLSAEYTTRGNNVLSTSGVSFKTGVDETTVDDLMDKFVVRIAEIMDKSIVKKVKNDDSFKDNLDSCVSKMSEKSSPDNKPRKNKIS